MLALHIEGSNARTTVLTTVNIVVDNGVLAKMNHQKGKQFKGGKENHPLKNPKPIPKQTAPERTSRKETGVQLGTKGCFVPNLNLNMLVCLDVPLFIVT